MSSDRPTDRMPEHDAAVVARARSGDMEAFRLLVERHSRNVYTVAYRVTGNCHDAEDIVQETFLKAYRQLDRFESRSSFSTWVHRIAMNCAIDFLRSRSRREQPETHETLEDLAAAAPSSHDAPMIAADRLVASAEIGQRIRTAMARLSPLERAAFVLRHFEGQSIDEISRALGVRQNAAKHCIFRAVRKMRVALEAFVE